jgi:hypothetical protein
MKMRPHGYPDIVRLAPVLATALLMALEGCSQPSTSGSAKAPPSASSSALVTPTTTTSSAPACPAPTRPAPRFNMAFVYMPSRQEAVLYGGDGATNGGLGDTWIWKSGCWTQQHPSSSPGVRDGMAAAFDPDHAVVVIYGGRTVAQLDTGTWVWDGINWLHKATAISPQLFPSAVAGYDPVSHRIVIFGMASGSQAQTWAWDGSSWQLLSPQHSPLGRMAPTLALDPTRGELLLFGGQVPGQSDIHDTWVWTGSDWSQLTPATSPPARFRAMMATWQVGLVIVLWGGVGPGIGGDAWKWDGHDWVSIASPGSVRADAAAIDIGPHLLFFGGDGPPNNYYNNFVAWDGTRWSTES